MASTRNAPLVIDGSPVQAGPTAGPSSRNAAAAEPHGRKRQRTQRDAPGRSQGAQAPASNSQPVLDLTSEPAARGRVASTSQQAADVVDLTALDDQPADDDVVVVGQTVAKKHKAAQPKPNLSFAAPSTSQPAPEEERYKCPICLEKFENNAVFTPCGHVYCAECLKEALKVSKKCPKCRKTVQPNKVHRLYLD